MKKQEIKRINTKEFSPDSIMWLNNQNPFDSMRFLKSAFTKAAARKRSPEEVRELWSDVMDVPHLLGSAIISKGVRDSLHGIFATLDPDKELLLPEDVYTFYWKAADEHNLAPQPFATLPNLDFEKLQSTSNNSIALLTNPLRPHGRVLNNVEMNNLKEWLAQSEERQLILDTVYSYQRGFDRTTHELIETGQCYLVHSLSKAWLERGSYGILVPPQNTATHIKWDEVLHTPSENACTSCYVALEKETELPYLQQTSFAQAWRKITQRIREFAPDFTPPSSGYFAAIEANHTEMQEKHGAHLIPASEFGSQNPDISVLSCLNYVQ